jgi:site-specific recombinase XerD
VERAVNFALQDKSPATRKAYRSDFAAFQAWCASRNVSSLPATPAQADAGLAASTIGRRASPVRYAHKLAGHEPPNNAEAVKATLRGIKRAVGTAPYRRAHAVAELACAMAGAAPDGLKGLRDRALLMLGFGGAFRRSELVALDVADVEFSDEGVRVTIRRSKTDQEGAGQTIEVDAAAPLYLSKNRL